MEIRAEYPPPKSLSKKKMAAMQAGETVYRPVHPACDQLAHLLFEVLFPHSVAQVCHLTVEKIYAEKARVIITIQSLKCMDAIELLNELGKRVIPGDEDPSRKFLGMGFFELVDALETDGLDSAAFEVVRRSQGAGFGDRIGYWFKSCCGMRDTMIQ